MEITLLTPLPSAISGTKLAGWSVDTLKCYDVAVIVTPHKDVDHDVLLEAGVMTVDTRNALKGRDSEHVIKL